ELPGHQIPDAGPAFRVAHGGEHVPWLVQREDARPLAGERPSVEAYLVVRRVDDIAEAGLFPVDPHAAGLDEFVRLSPGDGTAGCHVPIDAYPCHDMSFIQQK